MSHATIRGYACSFDRQFCPTSPYAMIVKPGAFSLAGKIPLWIDHVDLGVDASTADHVRLWQDSFGLAFEIAVATDQLDYLASDVANRRRDAVSVCFAPSRTSRVEMVGHQQTEIVTSSRLEEISFLEVGANPDARAWLALGGVDHAPWDLHALAARWRLGKQQQQLSARHTSPRSVPPAEAVQSAGRSLSNRGSPPSPRGPALMVTPGRTYSRSVPQSVVALMASSRFAEAAAMHRRASAALGQLIAGTAAAILN